MLVSFVLLLPLSIYLLTRVNERLTAQDQTALESLGVVPACREAKGNFVQEIACFRLVQQRLLERVPDLHCVHSWGAVSHEPADVLARHKGCCYSRSRVIEKALRLAGYETRHLSLYRRTHAVGLVDVFWPNQSSHSTSEVLTSRGWVVVDSNNQYVPVSEDGVPFTSLTLRDRAEKGGAAALPLAFMEGKYHVIYGLYSRHGGFYRPFVPLPDIAWKDLSYNFFP
ncbi:MAG TPA: transglutaminase domain-containing protein [Polyangiaceae bacterium]|nr:transglutaminase domain-containing protein [Polyangiaceae bacterium]